MFAGDFHHKRNAFGFPYEIETTFDCECTLQMRALPYLLCNSIFMIFFALLETYCRVAM